MVDFKNTPRFVLTVRDVLTYFLIRNSLIDDIREDYTVQDEIEDTYVHDEDSDSVAEHYIYYDDLSDDSDETYTPISYNISYDLDFDEFPSIAQAILEARDVESFSQIVVSGDQWKTVFVDMFGTFSRLIDSIPQGTIYDVARCRVMDETITDTERDSIYMSAYVNSIAKLLSGTSRAYLSADGNLCVECTGTMECVKLLHSDSFTRNICCGCTDEPHDDIDLDEYPLYRKYNLQKFY